MTSYVPGAPRIAYETAGREGPAVVFLHGIGGNRTNWADQLPVFAAAGFRAVAWDARGYGDSDDYEGPLRFCAFGDDLARLLDHLDVKRAHLVGLSMGGRILQDFHPRYPERAATLTLCATEPGFGSTMSAEERARFVALRQRPLFAGKTPADIAPSVARSLLGPKATGAAYNRLVASIGALHKESYLKTIEASVGDDAPVDLGRLEVPVLLVFGADDPLRPPTVGERMHAELPRSELVVVPDAGHLVNIEQPQAFNDAVLGFIRRWTP